MEGILWKWTNYWNGWQTRWFVLDNGILSYYKSQEEVSQGCKGSVKVSVCQINVNQMDVTRMDLVIPGQQHMYLRAPSPQDRQKWLVALGSAKACVDSKSNSKGFEDPNSLGHKKYELRLYCDLLMQQVHAVKNAALTEGGPELQERQKTMTFLYIYRLSYKFACYLLNTSWFTTLDDASSLLSATCDTFIRTLEDIMKLTSGNVAPVLPYEMPIPNPNIIMPKNGPSKSQTSAKIPRQSLTRSVSQENR